MITKNQRIDSIAVFTVYSWEHAIATLRLVGPLEGAGMQLLRGNEGGEIHPEIVSQADAVVIQREFPDYARHYQQIISLARDREIPVIYEIDDLLLELPDEHPDQAIDYYTPALFQILRAVLEADLVTTTTPELSDYLSMFNPNTAVLPNYLDESIWKPGRPKSAGSDTSIIIGYMGSSTHVPDLKLIAPALIHILDQYPGKIQFKVWGVEPPPPLQEHPQVNWIPLMIKDYTEFARYFSSQECDIYIAPLIDSHFNRCKSAVKYLEYSIQGIPGVYSDVAPYKRVINQGENGLLASTLDDWERHLVSLIEQPELRLKIGKQAQQNILDDWLLSQHAGEWRIAYQKAKEISKDNEKRQARDQFIRTYVRVSKQVRGWQEKILAGSAQKDRTIQQLQDQLSAIERSRSWKLIRYLRTLPNNFFPQKTERN
jgi:glycosyltransferase involved in cell wall biosynthesis